MKKILIFILLSSCINNQETEKNNSYDDLVILFDDWRLFEEPDLINGVHDYSVNSFDKRKPTYKLLRERLENFDISKWNISNQIDWHIIRAEMNGYDFNHKVLKPWIRDPAYYQSISVSYTHLTLPTTPYV